MRKLTKKQIATLRKIGREERVSAAQRRSLVARGLVTSDGQITEAGTAALPLLVVESPMTVEPGRRYGVQAAIPDVVVHQPSRTVVIRTQETDGYQDYACVDTDLEIRHGADGQGAIASGCVRVSCWGASSAHGGRRGLCFAAFLGDSGHVYVHRAPATSTWTGMEASGAAIRERLRKLGGATRGTIQQGDLLFVPANGRSLPPESYQHEVGALGHHVPALPLLQAWIGSERALLVREPTEIRHLPAQGATHPTITLPAGQWIVRTTASSLRGGGRD